MSNSRNSKHLILAATFDLLRHGGAGDLRIDAVAQTAGVNKRMIYHHFGDRQGLLDEAFKTLTALGQQTGVLEPFAEPLVQRFGLDKESLGGEFGHAEGEILRLLLAEALRNPSSVSEDLLTLLSNKIRDRQSAEPKPVFRLASVSRPSNPVSGST